MKYKLSLLTLTLAIVGCTSDIHLLPGQAYFKSFTYTGNDPELCEDSLADGQIFNPVLQGSYSDPSICRKGSDYYMVTATYSFFPGVAVLHSTDLVNWEQICYALPSEQQCLNTSLKTDQGVFPATIRYNKFDDYFYITGTLVGGGGHFIVKAKNPAGPWSDPEWLYGLGGVHPALFIDDNGKAYLLNQGRPDYVPPYPDFKAIWIQSIDLEKMKNVGERKIILAGGDIPEKKPTWLESPRLFKMDGYYYLTAAEGGGLGNGYSECVYRSKNVFGPYQRYENNPILTLRRFSPGRPEAVAGVGRTDFVQDVNNNWWAFFQGMRTYSESCDYNQGRETFLLPVKFDNGWPYIIRNGENITMKTQSPNGAKYNNDSIPYQRYIPHGNFTYVEHFMSDTLPMQWFNLRTPVGTPFIPNTNEGIIIPLEINNIRSIRHSGFIAMRQMHNNFTAETEMHFLPETESEFAGLALFTSDRTNYVYGITLSDNRPALSVIQSDKDGDRIFGKEVITMPIQESYEGRVYLRVERQADGFAFKYKFRSSDEFKELINKVSVEYLSCQRSTTFMGTVIGMYATQEEGAEK